MPNHLHLLVHQVNEGSLKRLMHGTMLSYSRYFNKINNRRGPLFESRYKASLIADNYYLQHISRYIHLNPKNWHNYTYSSLPYYVGGLKAEWIRVDKISGLLDSKNEYMDFLEDYVDYKRSLEIVKQELSSL